MSNYKRNVLVGAVVLVALAGLAWMILRFAGQAMNYFLAKGDPIRLVTERADGVLEGSPILYRGMNVGRVTTVRRRPSDDLIEINALIDADPPLPANLRGSIKQTSLLGGSSQILLVPRNNQSSPERLAAGAELPAEYVPDLTSLADDVRERQVIEHVDETVLALKSQVEKVGEAVDSFRELTDDPQMREDVRLAVRNIRQTTETARELGQKLNKMADEARATMGDVRGTVGEIRGTVGEVRGTVVDARGHVNRLSKNLDLQMERVAATLEHFEAVAAKVEKGEGTAGQFVNDPRLYESLADTAGELNGAIMDLRRLIQQWEQEGLPVKIGG